MPFQTRRSVLGTSGAVAGGLSGCLGGQEQPKGTAQDRTTGTAETAARTDVGPAKGPGALVRVAPGDDLQAALDEASGGGKVVLEPGEFPVSGEPLRIGSQTVLEGAGVGTSRIVRAEDSDLAVLLTNETYPNGDRNIVLRDLTVDGRYDRGNGKEGGVVSLSASRVRLENLHVTNGWRHCLELAQCTDVLAVHCDFDTAHYDDVVSIVDSSESYRIEEDDGGQVSEDIYFYQCQMHGATGNSNAENAQSWAHGFEFEEGPVHACLRDCRLYDNVGGDVKVKGSPIPGLLEFYNCRLESIPWEGDGYPRHQPGQHVKFVDSYLADGAFNPKGRLTVRGCTVEGPIVTKGAGSEVRDTTFREGATLSARVETQITGNRFAGGDGPQISVEGSAGDVGGTIVSNNVHTDLDSTPPVAVQSGGGGVVVQGNAFLGEGEYASVEGDGVVLGSNAGHSGGA
jgi:hypothetical protein